MPPTSPLTPPSQVPQPPAPRRAPAWARIRAKANTLAGVMVLLATILILGGVGGYLVGLTRTPATKTQQVQSLSADDISKLQQLGGSLGASGQTLNIGADSLFRGKVNVGGDLTVGGKLNANGPVVLSQLDITGTTAASGLNVGSNLTVGGVTVMQKSLTINDLVTINSGLNVSGAASVGSLNAAAISVRNLSVTGPLIVSHLQTQGAPPTATAGTAIGGGGTVSLSGNDTAGTINLNVGSAPPAGTLVTVVFRAAYTATPHVVLSPLSSAAATAGVYVTRTATGFLVRIDTPPPAGTVISFDYLVAQ